MRVTLNGGDPLTVPAPGTERAVPCPPPPLAPRALVGVDAPHRLFFGEEEENRGCPAPRMGQRVSGAGGSTGERHRPLALLGWGLPRGCLHDNV